MRQIQALWRCHRLEGCSLDFHDEKALNPLTLGHFVGKPNVRVRVRCQAGRCGFHRIWRVEEMVAGLEKRGQPGARAEVAALGPQMTAACPLCGKVNWMAEILWINTATQGWKVLGERAFEPRGEK